MFRRWTGQGKITKKEFINRKSILNGVFGYASEADLIPFNPIREVNTTGLHFKPVKKKTQSYTQRQRNDFMSYLSSIDQTGYSLAIRFACLVPLRIGELRGIQYSDVDFTRHSVWIYRQVRDERGVDVDLDTLTLTKTQRTSILKDPKGNPEYSIREIPLTSAAEAIIREAHRKTPFGEFLFMEYGRPLNGDTFNDWLKKYSLDAGIPYLSSHKLRFTVASHLYNGGKGLDLKVLQRILHLTFKSNHHKHFSIGVDRSLGTALLISGTSSTSIFKEIQLNLSKPPFRCFPDSNKASIYSKGRRMPSP